MCRLRAAMLLSALRTSSKISGSTFPPDTLQHKAFVRYGVHQEALDNVFRLIVAPLRVKCGEARPRHLCFLFLSLFS